jgi:DNA-binding transcriptional LysR family regulator
LFCVTENRNPNTAAAAQPPAGAAKAKGGTFRATASSLAATLHLPPLLQAFVNTVARQKQVGK